MNSCSIVNIGNKHQQEAATMLEWILQNCPDLPHEDNSDCLYRCFSPLVQFRHGSEVWIVCKFDEFKQFVEEIGIPLNELTEQDCMAFKDDIFKKEMARKREEALAEQRARFSATREADVARKRRSILI